MGECEEKQFEAHMSEYKELRAEITAYSQRIDRTVGVYLTALFALFGFLLQPGSDFTFVKYVAEVRSNSSRAGLLLLMGLLNSLLLIRIQSFYLAVLALSQYTATVTASRVTKLVGSSVLTWDGPKPSTEAKLRWLPVRGVAQAGFGVLAIALSTLFAWIAYPVSLGNLLLLSLLLLLAGLTAYACYVGFSIIVVGKRFHRKIAVRQVKHEITREP